MMSLSHVYWIGGAPCAGKTTLTHIFAQEHGWQTYHLDRHVEDYLKRADAEQHPQLTAYKSFGLKRFLSQPADVQLAQVFAMSAEQFPLLLADVRRMPTTSKILVEGANMLPRDVFKAAMGYERVVWMVPTEEFLLQTYPRRGNWVQDVLRQYPAEKERVDVFSKWMARDALMAQQAAEQARSLGIPVIVVDGERSIRENAALVEAIFGLR